nr:eukaryotic translation initiation factor 4G-like isoform X1 [Tanacetum cinerariifolium]
MGIGVGVMGSVFGVRKWGEKAGKRGTLDTLTTRVTVKSTDASVHKSTLGLQKVPRSNAVLSTSGSSGTTGPATLVNGSDALNAFFLQFETISPGVMN